MLKRLIEYIFAGPLIFVLCVLMVVGMSFICGNTIGLLTGYEYDSPVCVAYRRNEQTNLQYYLFPITPYACQKNGGLLQPGLSNLIEWAQSQRFPKEP